MTDRPYTDADLYAEAARQHAVLTEDPDFMGVGEQMDGDATWGRLSEDDFELAQNRIADLIGDAADVSKWAVQLGAAGLTPHEPIAIRSTTAGWEVAVQVATTDQLTDTARADLLDAIRDAVTSTTCRVLGLKPTQ